MSTHFTTAGSHVYTLTLPALTALNSVRMLLVPRPCRGHMSCQIQSSLRCPFTTKKSFTMPHTKWPRSVGSARPESASQRRRCSCWTVLRRTTVATITASTYAPNARAKAPAAAPKGGGHDAAAAVAGGAPPVNRAGVTPSALKRGAAAHHADAMPMTIAR